MVETPPEGTAAHSLLRRGRLTTSRLARFIGLFTKAGRKLIGADGVRGDAEQGSVAEAWGEVSGPGARLATADELAAAVEADNREESFRAGWGVEAFDREFFAEYAGRGGIANAAVARLVWGKSHEAAAVLAAVGCVPGCVYEEATLFPLKRDQLPPGAVDFSSLPPMGATPDGLLRGGEWPETVGPCPICKELGENRCLVSLEVKNVCPFVDDRRSSKLRVRSKAPASEVPIANIPQILLEMATTGAHRALFISYSEGYGLTGFVIERDEGADAFRAILRAVASVHALPKRPRMGFLDDHGSRAILEMKRTRFKLAFRVDSDDVLRRTQFTAPIFKVPFLR